ncbi:MAG: tyrosine-type recombinase/integrase [Actinomycetota bacterium]
MAHIEKRVDQLGKPYRARWRTPDGKARSKAFDRRIDAERFLASVENSKAIGTYVDPLLGRVTVDEWLTQWLDDVTPTLKPKTIASYESLLRSRIIPSIGALRLASLRPSDIQRWIGAMQSSGLSASRIRQAVVLVKQALDAAVQDGRIGRNVCQGVKLPTIQHREAEYFEPNVVDYIAENITPPYDLLTRILGVLGLRWGEAVALRRQDVDLLSRRLHVRQALAEVNGHFVFGPTKSHAARNVPLSPALATELDAHLESLSEPPDTLLFTGPKGGPLRYRYVYMRLWRPTLDDLKLPSVGLHVLRHSAAARLISAGASVKAVQTILGHRSAAFSLTVYGHLFDADLDDLAARLDRPASAPRPQIRGSSDRHSKKVL